MRFNTLFFLLIISCVCLAFAQVSYEDCCFKYVKKIGQRTKKHIVDYKFQVIDGGCNIPAVIFTMRRGRMLCADPKEKWVDDLIVRINQKKTDRRNGRNHFNKYRP